MKRIILLLLLIFSNSVLSQNVEKTIVLIDFDTNLPIEDVTVYIAKTKQTLLSNAEGKVTFVLKGISTIQATHSAYNEIKLRSTLLKEKVNVFYLKNNVNGLDEIIVTKKHPQKILNELVHNSKNKLTIPARLKVYSREFLKLNGNYAYYNDGLLNFQLYRNDKNFKNTILIEQNRSYGLLNDEIRDDALGYNLDNIMENYYNFKYLNPLLDVDSKSKYDFLIKTYSANSDYNLMVVTPTEGNKGLRDDYTILYDRTKKLIVEVSTIVSPTTLANVKEKKVVGSKNIYKSSFKAIYRIEDSEYYLIGSKEEIGFEKIERKKTTDIEVKNCFVVTHFNDKPFTYKDYEAFKDKTLYNKKNSILTNYWDVSGLTSTREEQKIIASFED
ncbi:hypothetical protein [Flavobacterium sangjuense]|uniref:Carboxypeptidase-like regulatory domain-containing protein n=1 Tax=Flavobacterium sangjuense TaxID=2518177 RepID=A0A4V1CC56_9FLAO|nr:hypothetical protein [Flavobacterium sangjuense]QBZ98314.1 hypothetical protein GS03_01819 [Flavobacterium sangjuense]